MSGRWSPLVLVALGAVALVAGCAREGPQPVEALNAAASKTLQAGSSHVSIVVAENSAELTATGAVDYRERRGQLKLEDVAPLRLPGGGGPGVVLLDGEQLFVRLPDPPPAAEGRPWLYIDFDTLGEAGVDIAPLMPLRRLDPVPAVTLLTGARDIRRVGQEKVAGEETTRYSANADVAALAQQLIPEVRGYFERAMVGIGPAVSIDAWIDGAGRVRRLTYSSDGASRAPEEAAPEGGAPEGKVSATLELSSFGTAAAVRNPARNETVPLVQLLARQRPGGVANGAGG